jgi:hypothetical protein
LSRGGLGHEHGHDAVDASQLVAAGFDQCFD